MRRVITLPARGSLLINTDLHGNLEDFIRLRAIFERLAAAGEAHWAILGDAVHGPSEAARREKLDVKTVVAMHSDPTPWAKLNEIVEAARKPL